MRIADVRENGPAWTGGIRGGDVMVKFAGTPITSLVDFTFALRGSKPGDEVEVKVLRDGMPLTVTVTLTTRP
jgi:S1-C subfamily serine protease